MTNVFISWSGEPSKAIAEELREWIPSVLQFVNPYFTPNDIDKGRKWGSEISAVLAKTHVGIFCLTPENREKPWILFEAGALSKDLEDSRVCSVLFGLKNTDLSGPLTNFQTTQFEKSDFKKLIATINDAGGENSLQTEAFESAFEKWWPDLEASIGAILDSQDHDLTSEIRSERELLEEILSLSRIAAKSDVSERASKIAGALIPIIDSCEKLTYAARATKRMDVLHLVQEQLNAIIYICDTQNLRGTFLEDDLKRLSLKIETAGMVLGS